MAYTFTRYDGRTADFSALVPELGAEKTAQIVRDKARVHDLARALRALRSAGWTHEEIREATAALLDGYPVASIV